MSSDAVILYAGYLSEGQTSLQRMNALTKIGCQIDPINYTTPHVLKKQQMLHNRIIRKLIGPQDYANANRLIVQATSNRKYDIVWIDKGLTITPETLIKINNSCPETFRVSYSPDDMFNPANQTKRYMESIPHYDLHITTKSYNVNELYEAGAKKVLLIGNAFDPSIHRPMEVTDDEIIYYGGDVGFIGDYEKDRANKLIFLANSGIKVKVWGSSSWKRMVGKYNNLIINPHPIWSEDYAKAIKSFKINLCFLRKANRDRVTTRSVEIPACCSFMLAERTEEHLSMFQEDAEAAFFESDKELLEKCIYYLSHEEERDSIAINGYKRCLNSNYSTVSRAEHMIKYILEIHGVQGDSI